MLENGRSITGLVFFDQGKKRPGGVANVIFRALFTLDLVKDPVLLQFSLNDPLHASIDLAAS